MPPFLFLLRCIISYRPTPTKLYVFGSFISYVFSYIVLQYARITQSRITTSFFVFSLFYFCAQFIIQNFILSLDFKYVNLLSGIIKGGNIPPANFTFLQGNKGHMNLQICDDIPFGRVHPCTTIYDSTWESVPNATQVIDARIESHDGSIVNLSEQCIEILLYPHQLYAHYSQSDYYYSHLLEYQITKLQRRRHDLLGSPNLALGHLLDHCSLRLGTSHVSTISLIPTGDIFRAYINRLAALIMRTLATEWAVYTTWRGPTFEANFQELIAGPTSPCSLDLFSLYWRTREIYGVRIHPHMYISLTF